MNRTVSGAEPDRAHRQILHRPRQARDGDQVADLHGVFEQQEHAGDDVLHELLRAETHSDADDAGAGQERRDIDPDGAQAVRPAMVRIVTMRAVRSMGRSVRRRAARA